MANDLVLQSAAVECPLVSALDVALKQGPTELTAVIDSYMAAAGKAGNSSVLPTVTKFFSEPSKLHRLINCVMAQRLDECVASSFNHHTGFDKLVLLSGDHFKLRLHNFHPVSVQRPSENIHNHRWSFASSIVSGYFVAEMFNPDKGGDINKWHYTYAKDGMISHGLDSLSHMTTHKLSKGMTYYMPTDAWHSITEVAPEGAVTVMMTGFADGETTEVYANHVLSKHEQGCVNRMLSPNDVIDILESIQDKLAVRC